MRNRANFEEDIRLAKTIEHDDALRAAAERMRLQQGVGVEKLVKKLLDYDGALKFFDLMAEGAGLSIENGEALKSFAIKHHVLAASRTYARNSVNYAGTRWKITGDATVQVVDGNGMVIAEVPKGENVVVLDPPSDLWDDLALCFQQCALDVAIRKTERWYSYFRLGAITAVCVLESYINRLGFDYLSRVKDVDESVQQELTGTGGRVTLRDKLKKWPKLFAAASGKPLERDLWDDGLFEHVDKVVHIRDSFVHEKRPVHIVKSGPEGLAALKSVAEIVRSSITRIGRAVAGQEPEWIRRHQEVLTDPLQAHRVGEEQEHANQLGIAAGMSEQYNRARLFVIEAKQADDRPTRLRQLITATYFAKALEEIMKEEAQKTGGQAGRAQISDWIHDTAPYSHVLRMILIHDFHRFGLMPLSDSAVAAWGPIKRTTLPRSEDKDILTMRGEEIFDDKANRWVRLVEVLESFLKGLRECAIQLPDRLKAMAARET